MNYPTPQTHIPPRPPQPSQLGPAFGLGRPCLSGPTVAVTRPTLAAEPPPPRLPPALLPAPCGVLGRAACSRAQPTSGSTPRGAVATGRSARENNRGDGVGRHDQSLAAGSWIPDACRRGHRAHRPSSAPPPLLAAVPCCPSTHQSRSAPGPWPHSARTNLHSYLHPGCFWAALGELNMGFSTRHTHAHTSALWVGLV
jgi:hypothetical protein